MYVTQQTLNPEPRELAVFVHFSGFRGCKASVWCGKAHVSASGFLGTPKP